MMSALTPHTMIRMIWWPPQVRPADRRCAPGVTVKWWRKQAFRHRWPTASRFGRRGEGLGDDLDVQRTPDSSCKYLRDDGRTWWDMSVDDLRSAVGSERSCRLRYEMWA